MKYYESTEEPPAGLRFSRENYTAPLGFYSEEILASASL